nr:hypothetical protein [Leptospira interrogans]
MERRGIYYKTIFFVGVFRTQQNAFLWVALENSAKRFPMGRVRKLSKTLSYGSR